MLKRGIPLCRRPFGRFVLLLAAVVLVLLAGCGAPPTEIQGAEQSALPGGTTAPQQQAPAVSEEGWYSSPEEVVLYLHLYGCLPGNYLTKQEARELGWNSSEGNLWEVAEGMSIGGDRFGNREGLLPEKEDRIWYECDVNFVGGYRGAERLLYSSDGLIYYTDDHYQSYTCLYGETGG